MNFPSWHSYPSIYNLGHSAVKELLASPVNVEEKVDGSQFSFGVGLDGELQLRSKGAAIHADAPERMFAKAVETAQSLAPSLTPGWTYRCEYLQKPKHNTLAYSRIPDRHLIIFDINSAEEEYLDYPAKFSEAARIGLECVPLIYSGMVESLTLFRSFLDRESTLGGQKIEGVVVKPITYKLFGPDKKVLLGKFVSEAFKEIHSGAWRVANPRSGDIILEISEKLKTPARWNKAIQHLRERGELQGSPRDIGLLIKETQSDIEKECAEEIRQALYAWAIPQVRRTVVHGLPEWYKDELLKQALNAAA